MLHRQSSKDARSRECRRLLLAHRWRVVAAVLLVVVVLPLACSYLDLLRHYPGSFEFPRDGRCESALNVGQWARIQAGSCGGSARPPATAACGDEGYEWRWGDAAQACGAARLDSGAVRQLLGGRSVVFAGDSNLRLLYGALLRAVGSDGGETPLVYGHQDFAYDLPGGVAAAFRWRPYPDNVSALLQDWDGAGGAPLSLVVGTGLWHALHVHDEREWADALEALLLAGRRFGRLFSRVRLFVLSVPNTVPSKVKTWQKWWHMTPARVARYNAALLRHGLLQPGGPFHLLDAYPLTRECGAPCTADGVHYINATYDALLQTWANVLRLTAGRE